MQLKLTKWVYLKMATDSLDLKFFHIQSCEITVHSLQLTNY